jgi:putative oxidoreductase
MNDEKLTAVALLWLRLITGAGMLFHGIPKIFGGRMPRFTKTVESMGFPQPEIFAWAAALSETAGGLLLILGLFTRPAALFIIVTMLVAALIRHADDPFRVKELPLAYAAMALTLLIAGAGRFSLDARAGRRARRKK